MLDKSNVAVDILLSCPRCGKCFERRFVVPQSMVDDIKEIKSVLCNSCGDKKKEEIEKRRQSLQVRDDE